MTNLNPDAVVEMMKKEFEKYGEEEFRWSKIWQTAGGEWGQCNMSEAMTGAKPDGAWLVAELGKRGIGLVSSTSSLFHFKGLKTSPDKLP